MVIHKLKKIIFFVYLYHMSLFASEYSLDQEKYQTIVNQIKDHLETSDKNFIDQSLSVSSPNNSQKEEYLKILDEIYSLINTPCNKNESYKLRYKHFIKKIRKAAKSEYYTSNKNTTLLEIQILKKLAHTLYAKIHMNSYYDKLTSSIASIGGYKPLNLAFKSEGEANADIKKRLKLLKIYLVDSTLFLNALKIGKKEFKHSKFDRFMHSYKGAVTWAKLDLNLSSSTPSIKFILTNKKNKERVHKFIRMSTPTIGSNKQSKINSEFKVYLDYLKQKNLQHSYINFQDNRMINYRSNISLRDFIKIWGFNNEQFRSKTIENLSLSSDYLSSIDVSTLGKDSSFYLQSGEYENTYDETSVFLNNFVKKLFTDSNEGFYFSTDWLTKNKKEALSLLDNLMKFLFPHKKTLSPEEKRYFIELSYFYLIDISLAEKYSINLTCKDGIDRAGSAHAMVYFMSLLFDIINQKHSLNDFEWRLKKMYGVFFSDALSVKKREIISSRFYPFQKAALFLVDKIYEDLELGKKLYDLSHFENLILH